MSPMYLICILISVALIPPQVNAESSNKLNINVVYSSPLCEVKGSCIFYLYTSFNWTNGVTLNQTSNSEYSTTLKYNTSLVGEKLYFSVTIYVLLTEVKNSTLTYIENNCARLAGGPIANGRNLGPTFTVNLISSSTSATVYPYFCRLSGELKKMELYSPQFNNTRIIYVSIPPNLAENNAATKMSFYMMPDGEVVSDFQNIAWQLQNEGRIPSILMIGIPSGEDRTYELTPSECNCPDTRPLACIPNTCNCTGLSPSGGNSLFFEFYEKTVLPAVMKAYNVTIQGKSTIGGWSLGGLTSCNGAITRPDLFGMGYCGSASLWWNCQEFAYKTIVGKSVGKTKLYIDFGTEEEIIEIGCLNAGPPLQELGFTLGENLWVKLFPGHGHEANSWFIRFWQMLLAFYENF